MRDKLVTNTNSARQENAYFKGRERNMQSKKQNETATSTLSTKWFPGNKISLFALGKRKLVTNGIWCEQRETSSRASESRTLWCACEDSRTNWLDYFTRGDRDAKFPCEWECARMRNGWGRGSKHWKQSQHESANVSQKKLHPGESAEWKKANILYITRQLSRGVSK